MNKNLTIAFCVIFSLLNTGGITQSKKTDSLITKYHRNSIYSIMLEHDDLRFGKEIKQEFFKIPVSDKYNNQNLSVRTVVTDNEDDQLDNIECFLKSNFVSKRLVSKWFNREKVSGSFSMDTIWSRGSYDATLSDYQIACKTIRGVSIIKDAGEELIENTFVIVNDIRYVDKEERAQKTKAILDLTSNLAGIVSGVSSGNTKDISSSISSLANSGSQISDLIAGFTVTVTSYLFCLEWNDSCASTFYNKYYLARGEVNDEKKMAYENDPNIFKLRYIGKYSVRSAKTVLRGLRSNEEVIRKVCARALDENIVKLQSMYEPFRVKSPICRIEGDTIYSSIGLKEGVTEESEFEVLECYQDENGRTRYQRVGIVKPIKDCIWDNRFMADLEEAVGANFQYTAFKTVSGRKFEPGLLLRQLK